MVRIETTRGLGSGVVFEVTPTDNKALVLTNYHVVEGETQVLVTVNDSESYTGTVLGYDSSRDLAVVSICCGSDFQALPFGDAESIPIGSDVVAIGYALGVPGSATVTRGIVSAVRYESDVDRWVIQTDAPINPGNSGGPLLSSSGEFLGVNTYVVRSTGSGIPVEGFGFAVSAVTVQRVLPDLKAGMAESFPTPTPPAEAPGGVYTSGEYWYTIDVPSGWRLDSSDDEAVVMWDPGSGATVWISVDDIDPDLYPTLDSYATAWEPAPAPEWEDFGIVSQRRVRTDRPVQAHEYVYTYKREGTAKRGVSQWYVTGRFVMRVSALADAVIWNFEKYRDTRLKLEETLASFEPSVYTSDRYGYSIALPPGWTPLDWLNYDYAASNPVGPGRIYVSVDTAVGYSSHQDVWAYGNARTVQDSTVLSRELVYAGRTNPGYRMDYTLVGGTTGTVFRGAVLVTLGGGNAVWVFVDDYQENWGDLSQLLDDIFLRVAVLP